MAKFLVHRRNITYQQIKVEAKNPEEAELKASKDPSLWKLARVLTEHSEDVTTVADVSNWEGF
jgi:hypothetical protein